MNTDKITTYLGLAKALITGIGGVAWTGADFHNPIFWGSVLYSVFSAFQGFLTNKAPA